MKFDADKIWSWVRPKNGQIIEFDLVRKEYLCWISKLIYKYEARKQPDLLLQIEKRVVTGYTKKFRTPRVIAGKEQSFQSSSEHYDVFIHYVGGEGLKSHRVSVIYDFDFLLIRRPILGTQVILALLAIAGCVATYDWCKIKTIRGYCFIMKKPRPSPRSYDDDID